VIRNCVARFSLAMMVLILLLGAFSLMQMSAAQAAETVVPAYGAPAYVDGSPVGGGAGYLNIISPSQAKYVVSTAAALKSALAAATSGQIVYVADGATITINSSNWYGKNSSSIGTGCFVKAGVTLAGGRGRAGVTGGIIKVDPALQPTTFSVLIWCAGAGSRVCGLTLVGAQQGTSGGNMWCGIWAGDDGEIYNNEIHGFGYGGVRVDRDITDVWIHHNYIHHNQQTGYGYGVSVNANDIYHRASAIVEGNKFDYARHVISGSKGRTSFIFRYNYLGANCTNSQIDVHGQNDGYLTKASGEYVYCAGEKIEVYNNTSINTRQPLVAIRGIPYSTGSISVHNNWSYLPSTYLFRYQNKDDTYTYLGPICQEMDAITGYSAPQEGSFVRMKAYSNWWGTTSPSSTSPSSTPTTNTEALPVPTLASPANGASTSDSTPFLDWSTVTAATTVQYGLQVDNNADFSSPVISKPLVKYSYVTLPTLSDGKYYWRVRAVDAAGNTSAWTSSWSFTIS
jgi:hypothetical protein